MMSVVNPMPGFTARNLSNDFEETRARITAMHQLQDAVTAALQRNVGALAQLGQPRVGFDQVISITFWMRRGEANAFEAIDRVNRIE